ncbi:hypothetical protein BHM03_00020992, partial [Ensete ventricosum]
WTLLVDPTEHEPRRQVKMGRRALCAPPSSLTYHRCWGTNDPLHSKNPRIRKQAATAA